ncbi:MAG: hypothetical protein EON86_13450 [Brevundimonas sp.]|nr:MAG: hypothetical protein EON86_13450 [Brevundimonas sp.]
MKSSAPFAALLLVCVALSGCTTAGRWLSGGDDRAEVLPGQIEPIHAAAIGQDQAVFWVSSNGCTQKADLTAVVRQAGGGSVITLRRINEDRCTRSQPQGVEMRWSFEELGLAPGSRVSVENPYQLTPST